VGLRDEILEQPDAIRRQLATDHGSLAALAAAVRSRGISTVTIAARGSSDHAAIYAQYVFGTRNRLTVALAAPSITSIYGVAPSFAGSLVIGISQSGASPDIVGVIEAAREQGAPTVAITNDPRSALASAAEFLIELDAGPELAVAATKTYTTSLVAIARLSAALEGGNTAAEAEIATLPGDIERALTVEDAVATIAGEMASTERCVVLGRGYEYATAREWALKLKELAQVFADPYSAADFQHGPLALVEPGVPILAVLPDGPAAAGVADLLRTLRRDLEAEILVLSDAAALRSLGSRSIELPGGVPEWLRPIVSIVPAQLFAYHLTRARGLDPELPRNLRKVTRTR